MKFKKGDIFQVVFVIIIVLVMAIMAMLVGKMSYEFSNAYKDPILQISQTGAQANNIIQTSAIPTMDFFIFFFFLGSNIGLVVSAIRTKYSATLIWLFILLLIIEILIASGVVNLYSGFSDVESLQPIPSMLFLTNILLSKYFPLIISCIGAVVLILMYSKTGGETNI